MKKKFMPILLSIIPVAGYSGTTLHINEVVFVHQQASSRTTALFLVERHSVTKDQPCTIQDNTYLSHWFDRDNEGKHARTVFWVESGRHKSPEVYKDLLSWGVDAANVPKEMNFAVMGTLGLTLADKSTYICKDVALAQTGFGLNNVWFTFSDTPSGVYHGIRYTDVTCINTVSKLKRPFRISVMSPNVFLVKPEGAEFSTTE